MLEEIIWKLKGRNIKTLDTLRVGLNRETCLLASQESEGYSNPYTIRKLRKRIREIRRLIRKTNPQNAFEDIVLDDVLSNIQAIDVYTSFFHLPSRTTTEKQKITVGKLLEGLYDGHSFTYLMELGKGFDYQSKHDLHRIRHWAEMHSYLPENKQIQEKVADYERKVKKVLEYFGKEVGLNGHEVDFQLIVGEENEWHPGIKTIKLDKNQLIFYKSGQRTKVMRGTWLVSMIHEYTHSLHQERSEKAMPRGLVINPMTLNSLSSETMYEGVARYMEKVALQWMSKKQKKLGLSQTDIKQARLIQEAEINDFLPDVIYTLLKIKERSGEKVNVDKTMENMFKTSYYSFSQELSENSPHVLLEYMNIVMGSSFVEGAIDSLVENHGQTWVNKNQAIILRGLMTGGFRPRAAQRFLTEVYLPQMEESGYVK
jgi:hypothetical protein